MNLYSGKQPLKVNYNLPRFKDRCSQSPITEDELESMLRDYIGKIEIDREVWELGVKLLKAKHSGEMKQNIEATRCLEGEKEKIDKDLGELLEMRMGEEITAEEYSQAKKKLLDRKQNLKEKLEDKEHTTNSWLELAESFFETAYQAREIMESKDFDKKRELVQTVGWNLFLEDKKLQFSFKKPYDVLLKPGIREDVQGRRESNPQ